MGETKETAVGFNGTVWDTVLVFTDEKSFRQALSGNPNILPIIGDTDEDRKKYPGVYIAGIKANLQVGPTKEQHTMLAIATILNSIALILHMLLNH